MTIGYGTIIIPLILKLLNQEFLNKNLNNIMAVGGNAHRFM